MIRRGAQVSVWTKEDWEKDEETATASYEGSLVEVSQVGVALHCMGSLIVLPWHRVMEVVADSDDAEVSR